MTMQYCPNNSELFREILENCFCVDKIENDSAALRTVSLSRTWHLKAEKRLTEGGSYPGLEN